VSAGLTGRAALGLGEPSAVGGHSTRVPDSEAGRQSISAPGLQNPGYFLRVVGGSTPLTPAPRCPRPIPYQATRKRRSAGPQSAIAGGFTRHCSFWASLRRFTAYVLQGRRGKWSYQNHGRFWYYLACSMWYPGGKSGMIWPVILRIQRGEQTTCLTREDARRVQGVGFFPNAPRLPCWSHVGSRLAEAQKKGCS